MIINEDCVKKVLDVFGFEYIYLEKCSLEEKIEIFQTSGIILSPHSGGLTMATFTNRQTKIIQIMSNNFYEDHYTILCDVLGIRNYKFSNLTNVDEHYNMNVDCEALTTYLEVHTS
jgi:capsular polysaccharide biosynthesis protein